MSFSEHKSRVDNDFLKAFFLALGKMQSNLPQVSSNGYLDRTFPTRAED